MITKAHIRGMDGNDHSSMVQRVIEYAPLFLTAVGFVCCLVIEIGEIPISKDVRDQCYSIIGSIGHYIALLMNVLYGRKYGLSWIKTIVFSYLSFLLIFAYVSGVWTDLDITLFGSGIIASYRSIMFLPLLCIIFARFCEQDTLQLCDFLTPWFFFKHGFVTLACWIEGCCAGRPWSWGLVSPLTGITVFPTQPCIIILSVAVAYWGLHYAKKQAYKANGTVFANSIIIYGFFRYLIELYTNNQRIWWVMSCLSVCSLAMIVQGVIFRCMAEKNSLTP